MFPSGPAGKRVINEIDKLMNLWFNESLLKNVAAKGIHPGLLLQKLSKYLKVKGHLNALERRLELWDEGKVLKLLDESKTTTTTKKKINKYSLVLPQ